ncbi:hypothetical protein [Micromonospora taraxaci]|uniref:hypothetical protein n=1 Tax=Micromonospora taraxaci TaxID=1316803 RepID=UPI0033A64171
MSGTWERCVREVTLAADPETVGALSGGWNCLSTSPWHLKDARSVRRGDAVRGCSALYEID